MNTIEQSYQNDNQLQDYCEIYTFTTLKNMYRYTSFYKDLVIDGNTYYHVSMMRENFRQDLVSGVITCNIQISISTYFGSYISNYPIEPVNVEIKRYLYNDLSVNVISFNGIIRSMSVGNNVCNLECSSSMFELGNKIPRVHVQINCNNELYDDVCRVNIFAHSPVHVVHFLEPLNRTKIFSFIFGMMLENTYRYGRMFKSSDFTGESRLITSSHVDLVNINNSYCIIEYPFENLNDGDTVRSIWGCDKAYETCGTIFNNQENFIGFNCVPGNANITQFDL